MLINSLYQIYLKLIALNKFKSPENHLKYTYIHTDK